MKDEMKKPKSVANVPYFMADMMLKRGDTFLAAS